MKGHSYLFFQLFPCKAQFFLFAQGKVSGFFKNKINGAFYFSQNFSFFLVFKETLFNLRFSMGMGVFFQATNWESCFA
jgi:hypothetical protein